jgi:hypothetical protein
MQMTTLSKFARQTYLNKLTHNLQTAIRQTKVKHSIIISHNFLQRTIQYGRQQNHLKGSLRKPNRSWARSTSEKSILFVEHVASIFTPNSDNHNDDDTVAHLNAPCQQSLPVRAFTPVDIKMP